MIAYQYLAIQYYYLRNQSKCKYYNDLASKGHIEDKNSYVRSLCEENLSKKLEQREKEKELDQQS